MFDALSRRVAGARARRLLFAAGVAAVAAALGAFLVRQASGWPPHEDETLALFVGRAPLGGLFEIVLGERGGAPLHFLLAWVVAHAGGGLGALRGVSVAFALASVPVIALLGLRLTRSRGVALAATAAVAASWVMLFHGIYGRMYSLFLFTSALSYLALVAALEGGGRRRWTLWVLAALATVATHPYGALVLASQGVYVLLVRTRVREALLAFGAVAVLGIPFWRADLVLAGRFDVGVGGGGEKLGGPVSVLRYLRQSAGDFSVAFEPGLTLILLVAALGLWRLARARPRAALLVAASVGTPAAALLLARLGSSTAPESRHLIFVLPFFGLLVATGLAGLAAPAPPALRPVVIVAGLAALVPGQLAWAWHKTPALFEREPGVRVETRAAAAAWLARTSRPDDVLFGYDPLFLGAWERDGRLARDVVPRADPTLALRELRSQRKPLGRGVWVLDRSDTNNWFRRLYVPLRYPEPREAFEVHAYGPFLIVRTVRPTVSIRRYLQQTRKVMLVGKSLYLGDADVNYDTVMRALRTLDG